MPKAPNFLKKREKYFMINRSNTKVAKLERRITIARGSELRITYEFSKSNKLKCLHIREWFLEHGKFYPTKRGVRISSRFVEAFYKSLEEASVEANLIDNDHSALSSSSQ